MGVLTVHLIMIKNNSTPIWPFCVTFMFRRIINKINTGSSVLGTNYCLKCDCEVIASCKNSKRKIKERLSDREPARSEWLVFFWIIQLQQSQYFEVKIWFGKRWLSLILELFAERLNKAEKGCCILVTMLSTAMSSEDSVVIKGRGLLEDTCECS